MDEKRLINAWDLMEWLDNIDLENMHRVLRCKKAKSLDTKGVRHMIDTVPTVDAVEVVRCKDCRYMGERMSVCRNVKVRGEILDIWVNPDDFCSYGERSADGE